ncbi:MAG: DUF6379 domain-containing protein [Pseudomonadota bacterium]|nr:DUF6379 domain-containing protein [Pseudomonadota bacterium]
MFDKYMIVEDGFRNVTEHGRTVGFQLNTRLPYYRGIGVSMVEDVAVAVDGEKYPRDAVTVVLRGRPMSLAEMEADYNERWEFGEIGTVIVRKAGGLAPGAHRVEVTDRLRISYLPFPLIGHDSKELVLK